MTDKLYLPPQGTTYATAGPADEVMRAEGPAGRYSDGIKGGASIVTVSWLTTPLGWQYLGAFFRNRTFRGAEPFLIDLVLDGSDVAVFTARFVPNTLKLAGLRGDARTIEAQLEVLPQADDASADDTVIGAWEALHA